MIEVIWTFRARDRLKGIYNKIAEDQPLNAERFIDKLIARGESLAEQPLRGRMVPEYQNQIIREVLRATIASSIKRICKK